LLLLVTESKNKKMAITETLTNTFTEPVPSTGEVLTLIEGSYDTYWKRFAELSDGDGKLEAESNQAKQEALTIRLYDPTKRTGNRLVDSLPSADLAEEWYLGMGSLNKLTGSSATMMIAAATLWERPRKVQTPDHSMSSRFVTEVGSIRLGQIPERMRRAVSDKAALAHINLAGQVMLDIARIPEQEHIAGRMLAADISYQINSGLTSLLLERSELNSVQSRVLSDALKTKYDAKFEILSLKNIKGELSGEDYEASYAQVLAEQVQDTLKTANKLINGDLHEHYSVALMRYALNTWQGQYRYGVRSTTRRQDEPHDGFSLKHLPRFSYDVQVGDISGASEDMLIQLKTNDEIEGTLPYAEGVVVLDDILAQGATNVEVRQEVMTGLTQMQGLIREVITGKFYEGSDTVIKQHVAMIREALSI
jgi:hypothetical protein